MHIVIDVIIFFAVYIIIPVSHEGLRFLIAFMAVGIVEARRIRQSRSQLPKVNDTHRTEQNPAELPRMDDPLHTSQISSEMLRAGDTQYKVQEPTEFKSLGIKFKVTKTRPSVVIGLIIAIGVIIALVAMSELGRQWEFETSFDQGLADLEAGKIQQAVNNLNKAIVLRSDDVGSHVNLGIAYLRQGNKNTSIQHFDTAIDLNPNVALAYSNRGLAYSIKGDYKQATLDLQQALQLDPDLAEAHAALGEIYYKRGELAKALTVLKEYARIREDKADPQVVSFITRIETLLELPVATAEAQQGGNLGTVAVGQRHVWIYHGKAGEVLSIFANADYASSSNPLEAILTANLLDTYLTVRSPDGTILAENDDAVGMFDTNARIDELTLPTSGAYEIEVRDKDYRQGGPYALVIKSAPVD